MSEFYTKYSKVIEAEFPRWNPHSSIPSGISLSVVFDHYTLENSRRDEDKVGLNLFFLAGNGMTKAVWAYHIKRLYQYSENNQSTLDWQLVNCVAVDQVNHGESAVENEGKLGWEYDWREGAHDLIQVAKHLRFIGVNVLVGHSMGGFQALYATTVAPMLFKFIIAVEPITHNHATQRGVFSKKLIPALARATKSDFKNEEEYYDYFYNKSFYKNLNKEILRDFVESEKVVHRDGTVSAKTTKEHQMITYQSAIGLWAEIGDQVARIVRVPVVYVIGENANWNDPTLVKEMIGLLSDVEQHVIPKGQHLVNLEQPDELLDIIKTSLNKRITKDDKSRNNIQQPLNKEEYNRIFKEEYSKLDAKFFTRKGKL